MPVCWVTDLFCPFSLLLCRSPVEGQLLEAGNEHFLRAQEGTLFISSLFISMMDCSVVFVIFFFFFSFIRFFPKPLALLRLALEEKWNNKKSKAYSHSDVCFHT